MTGNDSSPRGTYQVAICSMATFMGAILNANIFGELAVLASQFSQKSSEFQEKVD